MISQFNYDGRLSDKIENCLRWHLKIKACVAKIFIRDFTTCGNRFLFRLRAFIISWLGCYSLLQSTQITEPHTWHTRIATQFMHKLNHLHLYILPTTIEKIAFSRIWINKLQQKCQNKFIRWIKSNHHGKQIRRIAIIIWDAQSIFPYR